MVGKVGSVFSSTASQHGGQETTITSFHSTLLHHGMIIVGLPYSCEGITTMREVTGGTPYGATCVTGSGSELRMPSELELAHVPLSRRTRGPNRRPPRRRRCEPAMKLLPTTIVGSYPQPEWLIDRAKLAGRFPPRVRARELWRVPAEFLQEAQDDATIMAIKAQEDAGIDIITDGEMRRESYSNRFATALDGVDIDNPGSALDRSGHPNPVPRVVGKIRRRHAVEVDDVIFLRRHTDRRIKISVPGPFTMAQQAQIDHYGGSRELAAMDYAAAVNEEIRDLFAAGADVVQIDEPYMQARPEEARAWGQKALNLALDGVRGVTAVHICFGYAAIIHTRPSGYSFLPELQNCSCNQISIETAQSSLDCSVLAALAGKDHHARRDRSFRHAGRNPCDRRSSHPPRAALHERRENHRLHRLRHEVPAARRRRRQDASHGGRGRNRAAGT